MTREQLLEKSLESLREIAKAQGVKSITKYRKAELVEIIMNGGIVARNQPIFGAYSQLSQMPDPIAAAKAKQAAKAAKDAGTPPGCFRNLAARCRHTARCRTLGTAARCRRCKNSVGTNTRSDPNTRSDL